MPPMVPDAAASFAGVLRRFRTVGPLQSGGSIEQVLTEHIRGFIKASQGTYGNWRIHADLVTAAIGCSPKLVRQEELNHARSACSGSLLRQIRRLGRLFPIWLTGISLPMPGVKFVGHITYIHTWQGFLYLATMIDCHFKERSRLVYRRSHAHRISCRRTEKRGGNYTD
jgi:hypothetical protein